MIHAILDFLRSLTNPDRLIELLATMLSGWLGYAVLFGLVFSETGLLVGIVVPGDSLLFTVGVVAGAGRGCRRMRRDLSGGSGPWLPSRSGDRLLGSGVQRLCFGLVQRLAILVIAGELFVGFAGDGRAHKRHPDGQSRFGAGFLFTQRLTAVEADPHSAGDGR